MEYKVKSPKSWDLDKGDHPTMGPGQGRPPNHGTWPSVHKGTWMRAETASEPLG